MLLRSSRLLQSRASFLVVKSLTNGIRSQVTLASLTENTATPAENDEPIDKKHKRTETQNRPQRSTEELHEMHLEKLKSITEPLDLLFEKKDITSKALMSSLLSGIEKANVIGYRRYLNRTILSPYFVKIIQKSISELNNETQSVLPITPQEILNKAMYYEVADSMIFESVIEYLFKEGDVQAALTLWVTYLEYNSSQNLKHTSQTARNIALLSYLETCRISKTEPNLESLLGLLQIDRVPSSHRVKQQLESALNKNSERFTSLMESVDLLYYSSKGPNALTSLFRASQAAARNDARQLDTIYSEILKSSEVTKIKVNEETIATFMKLFAKVRQSKKAYQLWNEIVKSGIQPSLDSWNALLTVVASAPENKEQKLANLEGIFSNIKKPNDASYAILISGYNSVHEHEKIEKLASQEMLEKPLIAEAYLKSVHKVEDLTKAEALLKKFSASGIVFGTEAYASILLLLRLSNKEKEALSLLKYIKSERVKFDMKILAIELDLSLKEMLREGNIAGIAFYDNFLNEVKKNGNKLNDYTFTNLLQELGNLKAIKSLKQFSSYLEDTNRSSLAVQRQLVTTYFQLGDFKSAETAFENLIENGGKPSSVYFWNGVFSGLYATKQFSKVGGYYKVMKSLADTDAVLSNSSTLFYILLAAKFKKDTSLAEEVFTDIDSSSALKIKGNLGSLVNELEDLGAKVPESLKQKK